MIIDTEQWVVVGVFVFIFIASQLLISPTFGITHANNRKLKKRLAEIIASNGEIETSIVKQKYLLHLGRVARILELFPGIKHLSMLLEKAGYRQLAYRVTLVMGLIIIVLSILAWEYFHHIAIVFGVFVTGILLPIWWLKKKAATRLETFEAQLPEALQMMSRALRTGYSFLESMKIVAMEMAEPISQEFKLTYDEITYGRDVDVAFALMTERMPSLSLVSMTTAIMIQKETGGNLSEVLMRISLVLNARFKLQRRVKVIAAEGVMSAWILLSLPFVLFFVLSLMNGEYFKPLYESPDRMTYLGIFLGLEVVAGIWIRFIINIDV